MNMLIAEFSGTRGVRIGESSEGFHKVVRAKKPTLAEAVAENAKILVESGFKYSKNKASASAFKIFKSGSPHPTTAEISAFTEKIKSGQIPIKNAMCSQMVAASLAMSEIKTEGTILTPEFVKPANLPPAALESLLENSEHYETVGIIRVPPQ